MRYRREIFRGLEEEWTTAVDPNSTGTWRLYARSRQDLNYKQNCVA